MKNFINKITKKLSSLPTPVVVILKLISIPVVFVLAIVVIFKAFHLYHAIDSYFTKKSYSRDVKVVFEYNGDEYVINTKVKCLNKGVTINEGSMEWYTSWSINYDHQNEPITLKDGEKVKFGFYTAEEQRFASVMLERKIRGHAMVVCDAFLFDDKGISKVDRLNKYDGSEYDTRFRNMVYFKKKTLEEYDEYLKGKSYANDLGNLIYIYSVDPHPNIAAMGYAGKDNHSYKPLDIKIKSIDFGQKEILPTNFFNQN